MAGKKKKSGAAKTTQEPPAMKRVTGLVKNRGTGFEEFFADPPMTAAEAEEEQHNIYHPARLFVHRMEDCIQRFRGRRRLDPDHQKYFDAYLFLGGVDTCQRQFCGMDVAELKNLTPAERRSATARDTIHTAGNTFERFYNHNNPDHWDVDFYGVAAGFFAETVPVLAGEQPSDAIGVVEHFLRYVLQHDVCPEYADDIKRTMSLCRIAREELPMTWKLVGAMPGQFHLAALELFGGEGVYLPKELLPEGFDAKVFFNMAVLLAGTQAQADALESTADVRIVKEWQADLELVEFDHPHEDLVRVFKSLQLDPPNGPRGVIPAVGTATFKPCVVEDGWYRPYQPDPSTQPGVTLFLDEHLLKMVKPGLKFRLDLCELNVGVVFIRKTHGVFPSFHTFLPQQLMRGYKEPTENTRPAASVLDPDAEERQLASECKDL